MTEETKKKISRAKTSYCKSFNREIVAYFEAALSKRGKNGAIERIPSYVEFARRIGVTARTIENWRKKYPKFEEACIECDELMKATICGDALTFRMHANFAKFLLSSRYGMREKVEITNESSEVTVPKEVEEMLLQRGKRAST